MGCNGKYVVKSGQYVEVYSNTTGRLLASFKVISSMCKSILDRYLVFNHNVDIGDLDYRIKILRG